MKAKYPDGNWKKNELGSAFNKEKDVLKKLALYNDYITKYPPKSTKAVIDNFKSQMADAYTNAKIMMHIMNGVRTFPKQRGKQ
ncbi:MAG: hypothetical protein IPO42_10805 [Chitinophagaceae bacterium]|nr:hypothetical protein [Chitinophagaceae bacterium]